MVNGMRQPGRAAVSSRDRQPAPGPAARGDPALGALRDGVVGERGSEAALVVWVDVERRVERRGGRQRGLVEQVGEPGVLLSGPRRGRGPSWWDRWPGPVRSGI